MENNSTQNEWVRLGTAFLVGLVLGLGIYWVMDNNSGTSDTDILDSEVATTSVGVIQTENGLLIEEQVPGKAVTVAALRLKEPAWVAIHDDVNGTPGRILGAKMFESGTSSTITIGLLRGTEAGKTYLAVLRNDDGNPDEITSRKDFPVLDEDGKPIMIRFRVVTNSTSTATTSANDETTNFSVKQ